MEDKLLVLRCRRGSREALTRIYEKYKADLLLLALGLLNDKTAAEDVVHDVFLSFVRHLDTFRLTGSLKGYLLTCTANHARNWNKAERVRSAARRVGCASPVKVDLGQRFAIIRAVATCLVLAPLVFFGGGFLGPRGCF